MDSLTILQNYPLAKIAHFCHSYKKETNILKTQVDFSTHWIPLFLSLSFVFLSQDKLDLANSYAVLVQMIYQVPPHSSLSIWTLSGDPWESNLLRIHLNPSMWSGEVNRSLQAVRYNPDTTAASHCIYPWAQR